MKRNYFFVFIACLLVSCGTHKNLTKTPTAPEGIEFSKIENFKGFSVIYLPRSGKGFTENKSVSAPSNQTDAGIFVPGVKYNDAQLMYFQNIGSTKGDIDTQVEVVKKRFINHRIKKYPNAKLVYEKKKVAGRDVGFINFRVDEVNQSIYGYIIPHDSMAALLLIDVLVEGSNLQSFEKTMDETMRYMIHTMAFQN